MTATEELCRLLDERGVKYTKTVVTEGVLFTVVTSEEYYFVLVRGNDAGIEMWSQYFTPAQAIAATLGAGTCTVECFDDGIDEALDGSPIYTTPTWHLSCGHVCDGVEPPSFCPNCGRRIDR